MRTKTLLVLSGGTVALLALAPRRASRRNRLSRPPAITQPFPTSGGLGRALALYLLASPLLPYDIDWGGVWGGIWGFAGGVTDAIRSFVMEAITKAVKAVMDIMSLVEWAAQTAIHALDGSVAWLFQNAVNAANAVAGVVVDTYEMLDAAFKNFREQAKAMLENAWDGIKDWVEDNIGPWVKAIFGDVWDFLIALVDIGWDGLAFLANLVRDPINFIWDLIKDYVNLAIHQAMEELGFTWDVFWGLWWPFFAHQVGLPDNVDDLKLAANLLFTFALALIKDDLDDWAKDHGKEIKDLLERDISATVHANSDFLVGMLSDMLGVTYPADSLRKVPNVN